MGNKKARVKYKEYPVDDPSFRPPFHYHIVLVEPEIPQNTGNAGRLCVGTHSTLHLVGKLGFSIDAKEVRRAGLDYWHHVKLVQHESFEDWLTWFKQNEPGAPFYLLSKKTNISIYDQKIPQRAAFVFGKETKGLSDKILDAHQSSIFTIPMFSDKIRSLNLSNAISIVLYEGIRQNL